MGSIYKIGICDKKGQHIKELNQVEVVAGKGLLNDRNFKDKNGKYNQITFIELENINSYNKKFKTNIPAINFRRNVITKDINLNNLIGKEFSIGQVKLKAHDMCKPCKNLQIYLGQNNIIKEFLQKGGLRCEILTSGIISIGDIIKT